MNEVLKKIEERGFSTQESDDGSFSLPDRKSIIAKIKQRREKLEKIKQFISLKLYHQIADKLIHEESLIDQKLEEKEKEIVIKNTPQSLPKTFFEQKHLPAKTIRIE